jgi:hypothetical protein
MPCSACGHGSTNSKPPVLILGHQHIKDNKEKSLHLQRKAIIKKSVLKRSSTSKFNMFKKMSYY